MSPRLIGVGPLQGAERWYFRVGVVMDGKRRWWLVEFRDLGVEEAPVKFDEVPFLATEEEAVRRVWEWLYRLAYIYWDVFGYAACGSDDEYFWIVGGESSANPRYEHLLRLVPLRSEGA